MSTVQRRQFLRLSALGALALHPALARAQASAQAGSGFTIGVLPDTQFYSRYATPDTGNLYRARYGVEPYLEQTRWLARHREELGIAFVTHLGDIVDQADVAQEWEVASAAMSVLDDAALPYSVLPGNHDISEQRPTPFSAHFPASRSTCRERYPAANNECEYHLFRAAGRDFLVLALAWRADDAALDWAQGVLDAHPGVPTILTSHEITGITPQGEVFLTEEYGEHLWERLIAPNDQIFLTLAGHHHGAGYTVLRNTHGHEVIHVLQDYQMAYQGGNGLLGMLHCDLAAGTLTMTALSPWVSAKPADTLNQFDEVLLGEPDSWTLPLRLPQQPGSAPDYTARTRSLITTGYTAPAIDPGLLPHSAEDYPHVPAAAHWRPSASTPGRLIDVSGNNNHATTPEPGGLSVIPQSHPLSADGMALSWTHPHRSWLRTAPDAPLNSLTFEEGYTLETFLYLDPSFGEENFWMGALGRMGERGGEEPEEPPALLAVSSLREVQWSAVATRGDTSGTSNWSHEVPVGTWLHVAVVNDPVRNTVEMFVDHAPILRDVLGASGLATAHQPWLIGASIWAGKPDTPWVGGIGETRLVARPLGPGEWLTARG
ncbi:MULTISPECIES: LamG-like jellyroll fold domain-containing protein [unclassified Corynebacterium]|uniref:LamG-like jellyroll fold domain-containing protein n=1 Tax=unclassified Corynebacterium TaxID=2624378 RepID=UPI0029CAA0C0|nr:MULTISPECIES: LamG-like jellyroll fold domain-containing protein [unclassified Corynebacterium]WPF65313.1 metallophosphoesterase [Corynebacterium sp. 22KM0430]WPF67808.1 metallophosphoesterase [Corynebacterium sp. 21KM1197]